MFMESMTDWLYPMPRTAAEKIADVLSGFTGMVTQLNAAINQAEDEMADSVERETEAYQRYLEARDSEWALQEDVMDAMVQAEAVRTNIEALLADDTYDDDIMVVAR